MNETINLGWLKDYNDVKFAPKTLLSQIVDDTTGERLTLEGYTAQEPVNDPQPLKATSTKFISSISQNAKGIITATKQPLPVLSGGNNIALTASTNSEGVQEISFNLTGLLDIKHGSTGNTNGRIQIGQNPEVPIGAKATSEGNNTQAIGSYSHAEGEYTIAKGNYSHAEGSRTQAIGVDSHAEGYGSQALGSHSHAEGESTTAIGNYAHAEGVQTIAHGKGSHAEGKNSVAIGAYSRAGGIDTAIKVTLTEESSTEVTATIDFDSGYVFHQKLDFTTAQLQFYIDGGTNTIPIMNCTVEDDKTVKITTQSSIPSSYTEAYLLISTAASGDQSYASGMGSQSIGINSFTHGVTNIATAFNSAAFGEGNQATRSNQFVVGEYNKADTDALFIVGNGRDVTLLGETRTVRRNALSINSTGDTSFGGNLILSSDSYGTVLPPESTSVEGQIFFLIEG